MSAAVLTTPKRHINRRWFILAVGVIAVVAIVTLVLALLPRSDRFVEAADVRHGTAVAQLNANLKQQPLARDRLTQPVSGSDGSYDQLRSAL